MESGFLTLTSEPENATQPDFLDLVGKNVYTLAIGELSPFPQGFRGLDGNDTVYGSADAEFINGNKDNDLIFGGDGADTIHGGRGNDIIYGNAGNDSLLGDRGDDLIYGGQGNDILIGGSGDDTLVGDRGQDTLVGGEGSDLFVLRTDTAGIDPGAADIITDFNSSEDAIGLTQGLTEANLALEVVEGGTLIRVQGSELVLGRVNNVSPEQLSGRFIAADAVLDDSFGLPIDLGILNGTQTRSDFVGDSDIEDWYRFEIDTPSDFSLNLDGLSADADVELFKDLNANGQVDFGELLASSAAPGTNPEAINLNLDPSIYFIRVQQFQGDTNYNLTVTATPFTVPPDRAGNTLSEARDLGFIGEVDVNDFVGQSDPVDFYRFSLDGNKSFNFSLDPLSADASLELIQDTNGNGVVDEGEVLNSVIGSANSPGNSFGSLEAGTYYLRVFPVSGDTNYRLSLFATPGSLVGREVFPGIKGNDTIQESLSNQDFPNPRRFNTFADDYKLTDVVSGQNVQVSVNSSEFDTYLEVVDAFTGEVIAENDDIDGANGNFNSALNFTVAPRTEYIIRVSSYETPGLGDYTLTTVATETVVGDIPLGQTLAGDLSETDFGNPSRTGRFSDDYRLTGISPNQQVQIDLNSTEFDGYLQLVNEATGEIIGENDDAYRGTLNSQLSFTVESGINYLVRVTSFNEAAIGDYTLSASLPAPVGGLATIGKDENVQGFLNETDENNPLRLGTFKDDYQLTDVTVGEQIRVNLNSNTFDSYLQLVNAATGEVIDENNDVQSGNTDSELTFTVQPGIDYLVRVTSFAQNSTGSYSLSTTLESTPEQVPVTDWFSRNIVDAELQTLSRQLAADGVLDRNDMLALLRDAQDQGIVQWVELVDLKTLVDSDSDSAPFEIPDYYVQYLSNQVIGNFSNNTDATSFENQVGRWFFGTVAPPAAFREQTRADINNQTVNLYEFTYAQVPGSLVGSAGQEDPANARISHIDQGRFGNCAFLAALGATFGQMSSNDAETKSSSVIQDMIIPNGDGTYTVRFYSTPGNAEYVTVDSRVVTRDGQNFFGARADQERLVNNPTNSPIWVPLVERAYAQWRGDQVNEDGYDVIGNGDNVIDPLTRVTGRRTDLFSTRPGYNNTVTFEQIQNALDSGEFIQAGTGSSSDVAKESQNLIVNSHAYSVTNAYETPAGEQRIIVYNPWGVDGDMDPETNQRATRDGIQDGFIDLSYNDEFLKFYRNVGITSA